MEIYEIVDNFQKAKDVSATLTIYQALYNDAKEFKLSIITGDKNFKLNITVLKDIFEIPQIKTIFKYPNLSFLNPKIINEMSNGNSDIKIDYSISFESNTARYLHDYITQGEKYNNESFKKILKYLLDNNLNLDPMFYILENVSKGNETEEFYNNLISITTLMTCDMDYYDKNKKIKSTLTLEELRQKTNEDIEYLKNNSKQLIDTIQEFHMMMRLILLATVVSRFKYRNNMAFQLTYIVKFMHEKLQAMFLRELTVAVDYFERKQVEFFNKINNKKEFFEAIDNMAWDFAIIRLLENYYASRPEPSSDFFIPLIFTFDKGLLESLELFYCKDLLIFENDKHTIPIPIKTIMPKLKKYKLDKYFYEDEMLKRLKSDKKIDKEMLLVELENEVKKILKI